jgi:hypothetical protein
MHLVDILKNCGPFLWPLLALSVAVTYQPLRYLLTGLRPQRQRLEHLATIASSCGLLGSAYGLAHALAAGTHPDDIGQQLAIAVCSTVVGTVVAIQAGLWLMLCGDQDTPADVQRTGQISGEITLKRADRQTAAPHSIDKALL